MTEKTAGVAPEASAKWTIGFKLAAVVTLLVALVAVVVTVGLTELQYRNLVESKRLGGEMVTALAADGSSAAVVFGDEEAIRQQMAALLNNPAVLSVQIWGDEDGKLKLLGWRTRTASSKEPTSPPKAASSTGVHADRIEFVRLISSTRGKKAEGVIVTEFSLEAENDEAQRSRVRIALGSAVTALILVLGILLSARFVVVQPLLALMRAAERLAMGGFDRVPIQTQDEVGLLARAFERMAVAIAEREERIIAEEKARIARELEIAATMQMGLLPKTSEHPELEIVGRMVTADEVGGDFYDVLHDPRTGGTWITVGDVSGHGIDAGIVMLLTQAAFFTAHAAASKLEPEDTLKLVNGVLFSLLQRLSSNKYVTGLLASYRGNGCFDMAGAHPSPLVFRAAKGSVKGNAGYNPIEGVWLGIVPDAEGYVSAHVELAYGDILCLYTDGITEAIGLDGTLLDEDRFADILVRAATASQDLNVVADDVLKQVNDFAPKRTDDRSLVLIRRLPSAS